MCVPPDLTVTNLLAIRAKTAVLTIKLTLPHVRGVLVDFRRDRGRREWEATKKVEKCG